MKVAYNMDQGLVVYSCGEGVSCFGLSLEAVKTICSEIIQESTPLNYIDISASVFESLRAAFKDERFKTVRGYEVEKAAKREHVAAAIEALQYNRPLFIEYEDGYGMMSQEGICSSDGQTHVVYVGKTTGKVKALLHLETQQSDGGCQLSFHGMKRATVL